MHKYAHIVRTLADLPPLHDGYARCVHRCASQLVDTIIKRGLDYSRQGMLQSTARCYSSNEDMLKDQKTITDPRFRNASCIIFDITFEATHLLKQRRGGICYCCCCDAEECRNKKYKRNKKRARQFNKLLAREEIA